MSEIKRSYLYKLAADKLIESDTIKSFFKNPKDIIDLFLFSYNLSSRLEQLIEDNSFTLNNFNDYVDNLLKQDLNKTQLSMLRSAKKRVADYKIEYDNLDVYRIYIDELYNHQKDVIDNNFVILKTLYDKLAYTQNHIKLPQTFLSYAYKDKALSFSLFIYFLKNGGFLFVDWMWNGAFSNGNKLKTSLTKELSNSDQFLLLRTINSEIPGSKSRFDRQIRQWCSWEIGNYYKVNNKEKYVVSFYEEGSTPTSRNLILDGFKIMNNVHNGRIMEV